MTWMANPIMRTGAGAGAGFLASLAVRRVPNNALSPYLSGYGTSVALAGVGALAAYWYGRKYEDMAVSNAPAMFAMKAPSAGDVIALAGRDVDYQTVMCSTSENEKRVHQPMRALTLVAGTLGMFASLKAYRTQPDFKLEGLAMALGSGAIAAYNGYCLVRSHSQMTERYLPQMQPAA
ncbi:hypothetical protein K0U83_03290 [bacterium]|nr:hypothetical protein [bacterium]